MNIRGLCILSFLAAAAVCGCSSPKASDSKAARPDDRQEVRVVVPKADPVAAEKAETMVRRGKRQYEDGLLDSAQQTLEKAVQIDPWNNKAWYYLHCVQESIREQEKKEQRLRDFLRRSETI